MRYRENIRVILGLYRDNGKENGNHYSMLGLYMENGEEHGDYYFEFRVLGLGFRAQPFRHLHVPLCYAAHCLQHSTLGGCPMHALGQLIDGRSGYHVCS